MPDSDNSFQFRANQDLLSQLLQRVKTLEIDNSDARPWVPQLISVGVSPTYTAGSLVGSYIRRKGWVFATFQMVLAGWSPGTGAYAIRTPAWFPHLLLDTNLVAGSWWGYDASAAASTAGGLLSVTASPTALNPDFWLTTNTGAIATTPTTPWTWANGDKISGTLSFAVQPGY